MMSEERLLELFMEQRADCNEFIRRRLNELEGLNVPEGVTLSTMPPEVNVLMKQHGKMMLMADGRQIYHWRGKVMLVMCPPVFDFPKL